MEKSDRELAAACLNGDEEAWRGLVDRYRRLVYAVPRRAGLDEDAAGDVFQQVFVKLVRHLPRIEDPSKIKAWLVTTARRDTLAALKERSRLSQFDEPREEGRSDESVNLVPDERPLAEDVLIDLEWQHRVRTAVDSLDGRCRELLLLLFYRTPAPSYAEAAANLGMREGSVGPTRARCLQKVLELLEDME